MKTLWPWLAIFLIAMLVFRRKPGVVTVGDVSSSVTQDGGTKDALSAFVANATDFLSAQHVLKDLKINAVLGGCDQTGCRLGIPYKSAPGNGSYEWGILPRSFIDAYGITR